MQSSGQILQNGLRRRGQVGNGPSRKGIEVGEEKPSQAPRDLARCRFGYSPDLKAVRGEFKLSAPEIEEASWIGASGQLTQIGPAFGDTILLESFGVVKTHVESIDRPNGRYLLNRNLELKRSAEKEISAPVLLTERSGCGQTIRSRQLKLVREP